MTYKVIEFPAKVITQNDKHMVNDVEVEIISDREIHVGGNRIFLDEDNIIHFVADGDHDENAAIKINDAIKQLGDTIDGKVNVLTDLNKAGKSTPEARKIWKGSEKYEKSRKTALIGVHLVARVLASFVMGAGGKNQHIRYFNNEEEALIWLKV